MRKLLLIMIILLSVSSYSQRIVDTSRMYNKGVMGVFYNDCSLRALISSLDIKYVDAYQLLKKVYIKDQGISVENFINSIPAPYFVGFVRTNGVTSAEFIEKAPPGNYIAIAYGHTFTLRYINNEWILFGNPDDFEKQIVGVIIINKQ
jgi:hypothetical protein